ncbi:MAG: HPr kinase/phosphatase C-terminal domain-containing protein [Proteobacteria bacterium]|nr:HPr kinase/phosphatase C-terminal domain-containing protein [Pseudomonadota bacterium]
MPLHGTCVSIGQTGVLIRGASGAGKSDLALRLIDRGAMLVSDDYCDVAVENGQLVLSAPATIAGQMEVRGLGIVPVAHRPSVRLGLIVDLAHGAAIARLPEKTTEDLQGINVRWMSVDPTHASADAKIRLAVAALGQPHE